MKVMHRISLRATSTQRRKLEFLGVRVPVGVMLPDGGDPLTVFDVNEDHPNWRILQQLFCEWGAGDLISTKFSKSEIDFACWLELLPDWHHGYPQPNELEFGYRDVTYDLASYCPTCGIGLKQKAPFQMKGEPKWGRNGVLQLNWVFDEYFTTPQVFSSVFKPHGVDCRAVTNIKGVELETVVQLVAQEEIGIATQDLMEDRCSVCGQTKYLPVTKGFFPSLISEPSAAMVKSKEYFGSGASAYKSVLISQAVARALADEKVRGISVRPVAQAGSDEYL